MTDSRPQWTDQPDLRDGVVYEISDDLDLTVRIALAVRRPLLLRGDPGTGKSSLAAYLARTLELRYYEHVVTARTQPSDLLWTFDAVRRLGDAQLGRSPAGRRAGLRPDDHDYVDPGPLWWALAPESARRRGRPGRGPVRRPAAEPHPSLNERWHGRGAVVLIDEIDKADPDLPNALLVPLGTGEFTVAETGSVVRPEAGADGPPPPTLVVVTTNEERELPQAFLRRCVVAALPTPSKEELVIIARRHLERYVDRFTEKQVALIGGVATEFSTARAEAKQTGVRPPGTAEFLDALRACWNLGIELDTDQWRTLRQAALIKPLRIDDDQ